MSIDSAIAFLLAQHTTDSMVNQEPEITITRNAPPKERGRKSGKAVSYSKKEESNGAVAAPIQKTDTTTPKMLGLLLPPKGSLGPHGFLLAMRDAGKRDFQQHNEVTGTTRTIVKVDVTKVRGDQIQAISAYIGWDPILDFGTQETMARLQANRETSNFKDNGPSLDQRKSAARSLHGFVAGMPDMLQRKVEDLQGRERATVEAILSHDKDAMHTNGRSKQERQLSLGLADLERARLNEIRAELQRIG